MCAVGDAVLREVDQPAFLSRVNEAGALLANELRRLSRRHNLGQVRGRGLLLALDLKSPCGPDIVAEAFRRGLLLNAPQPDALRFMPALNVTDAEIGRMAASLDAILADRGSGASIPIEPR
jgi:acetylornithine/N-succinyldiaminopimelate aminotransferase